MATPYVSRLERTNWVDSWAEFAESEELKPKTSHLEVRTLVTRTKGDPDIFFAVVLNKVATAERFVGQGEDAGCCDG